MTVSKLVSNVGHTIFGTAVAGFGLSLGRDIYKRSKKTAGDSLIAIIIAFAVMAAIFGAVYLPFKSASKIVQWYPNPAKWFFLVLIPWSVAGAVGAWLAYNVGEFLYYAAFYDLPPGLDLEADPGIGFETFESSEAFKTFLMTCSAYLACNFGLGFLVGLNRRAKRKEIYDVEMYNQKFLDSHHIKEVDGGESFTHEDGEGHKLRLTSIGKDVVEFFAVGHRNKRAFIKIGPDGRFDTYSGVVNIGQ